MVGQAGVLVGLRACNMHRDPSARRLVAEEDFLQGEHHAQCRNGNPRDRAAHDARRLCRTERGPTKGCGCVDGRVL